MLKFYSKIDPNILLHIIWKVGEGIKGKMNNIVPEDECLQVASGVNLPKDHKFSGAHKHLPQLRNTKKTQECFVVIKGKVEVKLFDTDNKQIGKFILESGDCYVYLGGGHSFEVLEDNTFFYEFKNGPYFGREKDKEFI